MVLLRTTYMECLAPTTAPVLSSPLPGASVSVERLSADNYLPLFRAVGDPLRWAGRTNMGPLALQAVLAAPATQIAVLRMHGQAAGFCEFDVMAHGDSELVYFGVIPGMQKKRLGPFLLDAALRAHWQQHAPRRI